MVCYHAGPSQSFRGKRKGRDDSLEMCLLQNGVALSTLNQQGRGLVHRLDRGTSGVMVLAKTNRMHAVLLAEKFFLRRVDKSYQALVVKGDVPLPVRGMIDCDIDGRPAKSKYRVQKTSVGSLFARLQVKTEQGRRHQVRLHCAQGLGTPILLDPRYAGLAILSRLQSLSLEHKHLASRLAEHRAVQRFCLHADSLTIGGVGIQVKAPLPMWWQALEKELDKV